GCALRDAISQANSASDLGNGCTPGDSSGTDIIVLPASANHYKITSGGSPEDNNTVGDFDLRSDLRIEGGGAASTIVDGNNKDRVFDSQVGTAELRDLTVTGGKTPYGTDGITGTDGNPATGSDGGGISVAANLTLRR